jgi:REP element-mobilizing transposase RayT
MEKSNLKSPPVRFANDQMRFIQSIIPDICARGGWKFQTCAAGPDHIHVILTSPNDPEIIRRLLKRWIGQELSERYPSKRPTWWAECGSIRWINNERYLDDAINYVNRQQASMSRAVPGPFSKKIDLSV